MKAILTGGGTGGHIYPALAIAEAWRAADSGVRLDYIGAISGMEAGLVPEHGLTFHGVTARKLRKLASLDTIRVLAALAKGYREASDLIRSLAPDVVVGTGGYVAAATVIAAVRRGVPTVIHEQNAIPGRTNRWLARWASRVLVSFDVSATQFGRRPAEVTGLPVRAGIVSTEGRDEARGALGLDVAAFTVLVLGGSQGAQALNAAVLDWVRTLGEGIQVVHQVGARNLEGVRRDAAGLGAPGYSAYGFMDGAILSRAFRSADLVITRCGASTLAEIALNGLPAIYVPFPAAYADHQTANASALASQGAGVLLPQANLTAASLGNAVGELRDDTGRLARMAKASLAAARPDAAAAVVRAAVASARART